MEMICEVSENGMGMGVSFTTWSNKAGLAVQLEEKGEVSPLVMLRSHRATEHYCSIGICV